MKKAVIFSGGEKVSSGKIEEYLTKDSYIICCDSGTYLAKETGVTPDLIMGDFDSSSYDVFGDDVLKIKFPAEKDYTDTHLAINYAIEHGYTDLVLLGAFGGRCDHELCNIALLYEVYKKGCSMVIVGDKNTVTFISKDKPFIAKKDVITNRYVSVLPMGSSAFGLSIKGFKYELDDYDLKEFDNLCVSNELKDETGTITVTDGFAFVIVSDKN